jgi:cyclase
MLKKRLIFTLLFDSGRFMLSRNFRLQSVGNLDWLKKNYNFSQISYSIDELIVLDVTRKSRDIDHFCMALKQLTEGCFVPISAGGGINQINFAHKLLRSGADKIIINSGLFENRNFVSELASQFGEQCVVASMDIKSTPNGNYQVYSQNGMKCEVNSAEYWVNNVANQSVGEIYLNSIDRDGTGQGFDLGILELLPEGIKKPIILAGGAGNASHLSTALGDSRVDAVATANLLNFVGTGLKEARKSVVSSGIVLPMWNVELLEQYLRTGLDGPN